MQQEKVTLELSRADIETIVDILCYNLDYKKMAVKGVARTYNLTDVGNILTTLNEVLEPFLYSSDD